MNLTRFAFIREFSFAKIGSMIVLLAWCQISLFAQSPSVLWSQRYDGNSHLIDAAQVVKIAGNGDVIVAGRSESVGAAGDLLVVRYAASNGTIVWQRRISPPEGGDQACRAMAIDSVGHVLLAGVRYDSFGYSDVLMVKLAGDTGNVLWTQFYAGSAGGDDEVAAMAVDVQNHLVVTGSTTLANGTVQQLLMKRSSSSGEMIWNVATNVAVEQRAVSVVIDTAGRVLVGAVEKNANLQGDWIVTQYNGTSGAQLWRTRIDGAAHGDDVLTDMEASTSNDVLICGSMSLSNGARRAALVKCASATGSVIWQQLQSNALSSSDSVAQSLALDAQGDVGVVGKITALSGNGDDWWVAKCAGGTGQFAWEQRLVAAVANNEALVVRASDAGQWFVAGRVDSGQGNWDFKTVKLNTASGSVLWQRVQSYSSTSNDIISDMQVEAGSRVVVTGNTDGDWWTHVLVDLQVQEPLLTVSAVGGSVIADGSAVVFGTQAVRAELRQRWTLTNSGSASWQAQSWWIDGVNAADWSVTQAPALTLAPGASTVVELKFSSQQAGNRTAAFHLQHNAVNQNVFDVDLQAVALSAQNDSDGDGLNDVAELSLAGMGFLWQQAQPTLVQTFKQGVAAAGYIAPEQMETLALGSPILERDLATGGFRLQLKLQHSSALSQWSDLVPAQVNGSGGSAVINVQIAPSSSATQFYRIVGQRP